MSLTPATSRSPAVSLTPAVSRVPATAIVKRSQMGSIKYGVKNLFMLSLHNL